MVATVYVGTPGDDATLAMKQDQYVGACVQQMHKFSVMKCPCCQTLQHAAAMGNSLQKLLKAVALYDLLS